MYIAFKYLKSAITCTSDTAVANNWSISTNLKLYKTMWVYFDKNMTKVIKKKEAKAQILIYICGWKFVFVLQELSEKFSNLEIMAVEKERTLLSKCMFSLTFLYTIYN